MVDTFLHVCNIYIFFSLGPRFGARQSTSFSTSEVSNSCLSAQRALRDGYVTAILNIDIKAVRFGCCTQHVVSTKLTPAHYSLLPGPALSLRCRSSAGVSIRPSSYMSPSKFKSPSANSPAMRKFLRQSTRPRFGVLEAPPPNDKGSRRGVNTRR